MSHAITVGIDVGLFSVGMTGLRLDDDGIPIELLSPEVRIHDSGIGPEGKKYAVTRKNISGVARRARRMRKREKDRLHALERWMEGKGWGTKTPAAELVDPSNDYLPWQVRYLLVTEKLDEEALKKALPIALRHIARHRGWRSPYAKTSTMHKPVEYSAKFQDIKTRVMEYNGTISEDTDTPAEVVYNAGYPRDRRLRGGAGKHGKDTSLFDGTLEQRDNANEIHKMAAVQGLDNNLVKEIIDTVFAQVSPKGSAAERVGFDALPGQKNKRRAARASVVFQRSRIIEDVANMRVDGKPLSKDDRTAIVDLLVNADRPMTWDQVARFIDVDRSRLGGTADLNALPKPPMNNTLLKIRKTEIDSLNELWDEGEDAQRAIIVALGNTEKDDPNNPYTERVDALLAEMSDEELTKLDSIQLPVGRSAYSEDSLRRMSEVMVDQGVDLHEARKIVFGVDDSWTPPAPPLVEPTGNPAVDRVLVIINRWLANFIREHGQPDVINVENTRDGFSSEAVRRIKHRKNQLRAQDNQKLNEAHDLKGQGDRIRYRALRRQHDFCLYCGTRIAFTSCQIDHIVPRKGAGSTNTRDNLVAVCSGCNAEKSNKLFSVWAEQTNRPGVSLQDAITRVKAWERFSDDFRTMQNFKNFQSSVIARLKRTSEDDDLDGRSMESVAWMAKEVRDRLAYAHPNTKVHTYRGSVTASARALADMDLPLYGGRDKTRLDRRHHLVDAAIIATMTQAPARALMIRDTKRQAEEFTGIDNGWRNFMGYRGELTTWLDKGEALDSLLSEAISNNEIPVNREVRVSRDGSAHDDTILKAVRKKVGEAWSAQEIDKVLDEAAWLTLTGQPDFHPTTGLPADPEREIKVRSAVLGADKTLGVNPTNSAVIPVRGGCVTLTSSLHHTRVYRLPNGKTGIIRVYAHDLRKAKGSLLTERLAPQSLSLRYADSAVRKAYLDGTAVFERTLVTGDVLSIDCDALGAGSGASKVTEAFPDLREWEIVGFPSKTQVKLRPRVISTEGLDKTEASEEVKTIITRGWVITAHKVL